MISSLVVIPVDKQEHIIWRYHDHILAGHPGWKETYRAITNRFYRKSVRESTRRYVAACHISACNKPLNNKIDVHRQFRCLDAKLKVREIGH
jgi:hypothetical protein